MSESSVERIPETLSYVRAEMWKWKELSMPGISFISVFSNGKFLGGIIKGGE